ncbi:hypothetical protein ABW20_dc0103713 [Dactylellina cionopaga]|nr:hypothetical protein ABW20_dc0103713 [Dactylellina cionopaga]
MPVVASEGGDNQAAPPTKKKPKIYSKKGKGAALSQTSGNKVGNAIVLSDTEVEGENSVSQKAVEDTIVPAKLATLKSKGGGDTVMQDRQPVIRRPRKLLQAEVHLLDQKYKEERALLIIDQGQAALSEELVPSSETPGKLAPFVLPPTIDHQPDQVAKTLEAATSILNSSSNKPNPVALLRPAAPLSDNFPSFSTSPSDTEPQITQESRIPDLSLNEPETPTPTPSVRFLRPTPLEAAIVLRDIPKIKDPLDLGDLNNIPQFSPPNKESKFYPPPKAQVNPRELAQIALTKNGIIPTKSWELSESRFRNLTGANSTADFQRAPNAEIIARALAPYTSKNIFDGNILELGDLPPITANGKIKWQPRSVNPAANHRSASSSAPAHSRTASSGQLNIEKEQRGKVAKKGAAAKVSKVVRAPKSKTKLERDIDCLKEAGLMEGDEEEFFSTALGVQAKLREVTEFKPVSETRNEIQSSSNNKFAGFNDPDLPSHGMIDWEDMFNPSLGLDLLNPKDIWQVDEGSKEKGKQKVTPRFDTVLPRLPFEVLDVEEPSFVNDPVTSWLEDLEGPEAVGLDELDSAFEKMWDDNGGRPLPLVAPMGTPKTVEVTETVEPVANEMEVEEIGARKMEKKKAVEEMVIKDIEMEDIEMEEHAAAPIMKVKDYDDDDDIEVIAPSSPLTPALSTVSIPPTFQADDMPKIIDITDCLHSVSYIDLTTEQDEMEQKIGELLALSPDEEENLIPKELEFKERERTCPDPESTIEELPISLQKKRLQSPLQSTKTEVLAEIVIPTINKTTSQTCPISTPTSQATTATDARAKRGVEVPSSSPQFIRHNTRSQASLHNLNTPPRLPTPRDYTKTTAASTRSRMNQVLVGGGKAGSDGSPSSRASTPKSVCSDSTARRSNSGKKSSRANASYTERSYYFRESLGEGEGEGAGDDDVDMV